MISAAAHLVRLARAGFVFAREGVFGIVDTRGLPLPARPAITLARLIERPRRGAARAGLSRALTRLGPTYVKLGQFLATRPDVVGTHIARDLERLQDKMPPFPQARGRGRRRRRLRASRSRSVYRELRTAGRRRLHRAGAPRRSRHADGARKPVAVKILRPGIERRFRPISTPSISPRAPPNTFRPKARRLRLVEVVDDAARSVAAGDGFPPRSGRAVRNGGEHAARTPTSACPAVDWDRTARDVLTLEWIDGTPLNDRAALEAKGFDLPALGRSVIQNFLRHALRDGFFHADMHPGNLFVDGEGRLVAVDFGIMGRLGPKERRFLAEILFGFITRDYHRVAQVHFDAGYVPRHHSVDAFAQAIRAIGEPIHNRTAEDISMAKLLTLLFEVTGLFDMRTRPELILLQKTMVVVEGVARALDPKLDMWRTSDPVVREWISRNLGPIGMLEGATQGVGEIGRFLADVPSLLTRTGMLLEQMDELTRGGLVLSPDTIERIGAAEARRNRPLGVAVWLIAILLFAIAWMLI